MHTFLVLSADYYSMGVLRNVHFTFEHNFSRRLVEP